MKKTMLALLMIMMCTLMMVTGCKSETPTDVVNLYFSTIKKSDSKEAQKLIEDTIADEVLNKDTGETSTDDKTSDSSKKKESEPLDKSLQMYLSKVDAKVISEKINKDKATVKVEVKAPNYSDLLLKVMEESIADTFGGKEVNQSDVEKNLEKKIKESKSYDRSGQINLTKKDNKWEIKSDEDIVKLLLGEADEKESIMFSK